MKLIISKQHFAVEVMTRKERGVLNKFKDGFKTYKEVYDWKVRKNVKMVDKEFYGGNTTLGIYRFHIHYLNVFVKFIKYHGIEKENITLEMKDNSKKYRRVDINLLDHIELRDYQLDSVNLGRDVIERNRYSMLLDHQMGKGKGIMSTKIISDIGLVTAIIILPRYMDKWKTELLEISDLEEDDIWLIRGSAGLNKLAEYDFSESKRDKVFIFSNTTIRNYIRHYEEAKKDEDFNYYLDPSELLPHIGAGIVVVDETHQEFHSVYKAMMYFDPTVLIGMSATLEDDDPIKLRYNYVLYPNDVRLSSIGYDKYINLYYTNYRIVTNRGINYMGSRGYSHTTFEGSIIKIGKTLLRNYINLIKRVLDAGYISRYEEDTDKVIVFAATVEMCTILTEEFSKSYPDRVVRRYVESDPYENVEEGNIIVSTPLSIGTGFDVKNLITVVQTIVLKSSAANKQIIGRLRDLKHKGRDIPVEFYYIFSDDIDKHVEYHKYRLDIFKHIIKRVNRLDVFAEI